MKKLNKLSTIGMVLEVLIGILAIATYFYSKNISFLIYPTYVVTKLLIVLDIIKLKKTN